jgi:hypothetical protein
MRLSVVLILCPWFCCQGHAQQKPQAPPRMVLVPGNDQIKPFYMDQYEKKIDVIFSKTAIQSFSNPDKTF